jgi:hypothetical protein
VQVDPQQLAGDELAGAGVRDQPVVGGVGLIPEVQPAATVAQASDQQGAAPPGSARRLGSARR